MAGLRFIQVSAEEKRPENADKKITLIFFIIYARVFSNEYVAVTPYACDAQNYVNIGLADSLFLIGTQL